MRDNLINKKLKLKFFDSTNLRQKSIEDSILRTGPERVSIFLNNSCNFNCVTCWDYSPLLKKQRSKKWMATKIKKELVFHLLDELVNLGCVGVIFTGYGEPLLHPNINSFIKRAKKNYMSVGITTNLSSVKDPCELADCLTLPMDSIFVHLSAATPKTYVRMHPNQSKKDFYKILNNIKILVSRLVSVKLIYIVTKLNYKEIPKMIKLNKDLKTKLHFELMDFHLNSGLNKISLEKKSKKEIITYFSGLRMQEKFRAENNIKDFLDQLIYSGLGFKKLERCCIGYFWSVINELGHVYYCCDSKKNFFMGDLNKKSFKDIWFSQRYQQFRTRFLEGKFLKDCQQCINGKGTNFKTRAYINPEIRNFDAEKAAF